ncbi:MAG: LOG family protein [Phycisphaeraceae bacterium]|nr:LOG family protein [Phycisphaeraceae bacterium]MCW5761645.1 LOG family protein [Phycisphaeraceae bacterium]
MSNEHNRTELDPPASTQPREQSAAPPEVGSQRRADDGQIQDRVRELIEDVSGPADEYDARLVRELITAALKLLPDGRDRGELKLMTAAMKELRYAFRVFGQYPDPHKVTIFGSARTPQDHPDYLAAVAFSRIMAERGWMVITGAGDGIMKAGHEGPGREASFGVAIRLPFETTANDIIADDEKLIHFRYFFTRKLMFLSQAEAVVCFPGGFGTLDETYETLTLVQTGKASIIPIVFVEGEPVEGRAVAGGDTSKAIAGYWSGWKTFVDDQLMRRGWISPEDDNLFYIARDPKDAADHIDQFYRVYHSSRYVRDQLVIRLKHEIRDEDVAMLAREFASLIKTGTIEKSGPLRTEEDNLSLPRLVFTHNRRKYGLVRLLIDRINRCPALE